MGRALRIAERWHGRYLLRSRCESARGLEAWSLEWGHGSNRRAWSRSTEFRAGPGPKRWPLANACARRLRWTGTRDTESRAWVDRTTGAANPRQFCRADP